MELEEIRTAGLAWQAEHNAAAQVEGWALLHCEGSSNGEWQVQVRDDSDLLSEDEAAWRLVLEGSAPHHISIRKLIRRINPMEWDCFVSFVTRLSADGTPLDLSNLDDEDKLALITATLELPSS
jgi:hypothetical protein